MQCRCPGPEYSLNLEGPGSEALVVGNTDGSSRIRVVFEVDHGELQVDLYRPLGMGWNHVPFEKELLDLSRATFLVSEELHLQHLSNQAHP